MKTIKFYTSYFSDQNHFLQQIARWNLFALLTIIIFSFTARSQTEGWLWAQHAGGIFNQAAGHGITADAFGNVLVSGAYSCPQMTFGNITLVNNGGDDIFLVKFDEDGNALWGATAGDDYADECYGVATDHKGNVFITGEFWSSSVTFGNYTINNSGSSDIYIVKYDADGTVLWAKSASGPDEDHSNGIAVDLAGNVYITGSFISNSVTFDNVTLTNSQSGYEDMYMAKYDGDGNLIWAMNPSGSSRDQGFGITVDSHDDVFLTGNFRSPQLNFGNVTINNSGGDDMFIAKFDSGGNALWAHNAAGFSYDYGFAIAVDVNSNAYVAGQFGSPFLTFGNIQINNGGLDDIFVARYNADGNAQWAQVAGGFGYDYGYGIAVDKESNVFITGSFQSSPLSLGNISLANHASSGYDFCIAKYDSSGNIQWAQNDSSSEYAWGYNCAADGAGNLYVTGLYGPSAMMLDTIELNTEGGYDMYIAKYGTSKGEPTGITEMTEVERGISLYPNPAVDKFTLDLSLNEKVSEEATIEITNLFGRTLYSENVFVKKGQLLKEISFNPSIANGMYLVKVIVSEQVYSQTLFFQK